MANGVQDAPRQAWVFHGPPDTAHNKGTGEGKIHDQPDDTTYSQPVHERNNYYPVPGIVLSCLFNEGEYSSYRQAGIAQGIDKIDDAPEPFPVCFRFQHALLSTLPLVRQAGVFSQIIDVGSLIL